MGRIDAPLVHRAYDLAEQVRAGGLSETAAIDTLAGDHGMNRNSATIYVRSLATMHAGRTLTRSMIAPAVAIYLERIAEDHGMAAARVALASVRGHISYYGGLGRGTLGAMTALCDTLDTRWNDAAK
jgi:5-methylcytosine-specific restriction enzyme A